VLALYDTAARGVRSLDVGQDRLFRLYVCGPTVYELPHVGHGRALLVYDVLRRYLEGRGVPVRHVSNVTDVDDKIIARALSEGETPEAIAARYEEEWWAASDRLGVLRPSSAPRATEYIEEMVGLIAELVAARVAYEAPDGVYLETGKVSDYGLLTPQALADLRAGARVETVAGKRSPLDFALWKLAKPAEPAWPSPWGAGRPGWHTECVVMALGLLGEDFDLHAGGTDLRFPHHENERAQASALGRGFARHWMHHEMVNAAGGEKMARSAGNFTTLTELLDEVDPRAYRLLVLRAQYRQPMEVSPAALADATAGLARLDALARRLLAPGGSAPGGSGSGGSAPGGIAADPAVLERFGACLADDLDTPGAAAVLFDAVRAANAAADAGDNETAAGLARAVEAAAAWVGLPLHGGRAEVPEAVQELVARRERARTARDFAAADRLRDELARAGWAVEDTPAGSLVRPSSA
jgi:cysteinyl-tRNA synthetase